MIDFKPIKLLDKTEINKIFRGNNYRTSDLSFANLYAWSSRYNTEIAIKENTLFLRSKSSEKDCSYMMPIGAMPLNDAISIIKKDAEDRQSTFRFVGVTKEMWIKLDETMPGLFSYFEDRNEYEYIYLTESLIGLSGKKLQSKRNHINRFKAENPDWKYSKISTQDEIEECIEMLNNWERSVAFRMQKSQRDEYFATRKLLEDFNELGLHVGIIRVNGEIVAFSIGEPLTEDTFVVHSEKAFSEINGAYTIMNQQFAANEAIGYKYINREEDLGIENLRKAKMSYYPEILLEQGTVLLKNS